MTAPPAASTGKPWGLLYVGRYAGRRLVVDRPRRGRFRESTCAAWTSPSAGTSADGVRPPGPRRLPWPGDLGMTRPPVRHLVRARDLADARYAEPLTVDDLAAAACLSRGALQPRVPPRLRRVAALLPAHPAPRAGGDAAAQHRLHRRRHLHAGRADERRLVHDELHAGLRRDADGVPRVVPAGRRRLARIPLCVLRAYGRPANSTIGEDAALSALPRFVASTATGPDTRRTP